MVCEDIRTSIGSPSKAGRTAHADHERRTHDGGSWKLGKDVEVLETFGSSYKLNAQTQLLALEAMLANFKSDYEAIERQYPSHIAEGSPEIQLPHMGESHLFAGETCIRNSGYAIKNAGG